MCNYDFGDAGFCEGKPETPNPLTLSKHLIFNLISDCSDFPTEKACIDTGFATQRGIDECLAICVNHNSNSGIQTISSGFLYLSTSRLFKFKFC